MKKGIEGNIRLFSKSQQVINLHIAEEEYINYDKSTKILQQHHIDSLEKWKRINDLQKA